MESRRRSQLDAAGRFFTLSSPSAHPPAPDAAPRPVRRPAQSDTSSSSSTADDGAAPLRRPASGLILSKQASLPSTADVAGPSSPSLPIRPISNSNSHPHLSCWTAIAGARAQSRSSCQSLAFTTGSANDASSPPHSPLPVRPPSFDADASAGQERPRPGDPAPVQSVEGLMFRTRGGRRLRSMTSLSSASASASGAVTRKTLSRPASSLGHRDTEPITSDPDAPSTRCLPIARRAEPRTSYLTHYQKWTLLLLFLQCLSVVPAFFGTLYCASRVWYGPTAAIKHRDAVAGMFQPKSTRLDYFVAGVWAFMSGYWCWSVASGLLRRWLVYYEFIPAMVRLASLQAIVWPLTRFTLSFVGWDQPILGWIICAASAAISNTVQLYVTSNIRLSASHKPASWSLSIPQLSASAPKYRALNLRQAIIRNGMPLALLAWGTLPVLYWEVYQLRWAEAGGMTPWSTFPTIPTTTFKSKMVNESSTSTSPFTMKGNINVLVIVTSSWTDSSFTNRAIFRNTSVKLMPTPSNTIVFDYRFLMGEPASPSILAHPEQNLTHEIMTHGDIVILPTPDGSGQVSEKLYWAYEWSMQWDFDYLIKNDDDMFIRFDTLSQELSALGKQERYWKGLAYHNIPSSSSSTTQGSSGTVSNFEFTYDLPILPPFTSGALTILSHDVVTLVTITGSQKLFTPHDDQNLGIWLYPTGIRPIHDVRVQGDHEVCENDMVAKRLSSPLKDEEEEEEKHGGENDAVKMYNNILNGKPQCQGF